LTRGAREHPNFSAGNSQSTSFEGRTWKGRVKYADIGPSIDALPLTSGFFGYAHDMRFGDVVDPIFGLLEGRFLGHHCIIAPNIMSPG
jgi:hypothetical protein